MNFMERFLAPLRGVMAHADRAGPLEVQRKYGWMRYAERHPKYWADAAIADVNANCNIAIRAISDAVRSVPTRVYGTEVVGARENRYIDPDHEGNVLINHPNPDMTLGEVLRHNVKSLLATGNAYCTIEVMTGPNRRIEVWPQNPRSVDVRIDRGRVVGYEFGKYETNSRIYKPSRVLHIRESDLTEPLYGKPRHEAVRDEIYMDWLVNQFNKNFFLNDGMLGVMFTPDKNLTEAQHAQLMEAWKEEAQGVKNAFRIFINRFNGKFTTVDQKHNEIAFAELLKQNREKIFGAYGLPPFRGGVMEYANYANALAQDKDFWLNTVKPIVVTVLEAWNKQILWRYWSDDVEYDADYSAIEALKGDPKQQAEVHKIYLDAGAMTKDEVREQLDMGPLEEEEDTQGPTGDAERNPDNEEEPGAEPDREEEGELRRGLQRHFSRQRRALDAAVAKRTQHGSMMSMLYDPTRLVAEALPPGEQRRSLEAEVLPTMLRVMRRAGHATMAAYNSEFRDEGRSWNRASTYLRTCLEQINKETMRLATQEVEDADRFNHSYGRLRKALRRIFLGGRVDSVLAILRAKLSGQINRLTYEAKGAESRHLIDRRTRKEEVA